MSAPLTSPQAAPGGCEDGADLGPGSGDTVEAWWGPAGQWLKASVVSRNLDGSFHVRWDIDGKHTRRLAPAHLRAPRNTAATTTGDGGGSSRGRGESSAPRSTHVTAKDPDASPRARGAKGEDGKCSLM